MTCGIILGSVHKDNSGLENPVPLLLLLLSSWLLLRLLLISLSLFSWMLVFRCYIESKHRSEPYLIGKGEGAFDICK